MINQLYRAKNVNRLKDAQKEEWFENGRQDLKEEEKKVVL